MPGAITRTVIGQLRTVLVEAEFSALDEDHLVAQGGVWAADYVPQTVLRLHSRESDDPNSRPQLIQVGPGALDMDPALLVDYRASVREFFTMPKSHLLVGRVMRGVYTNGPALKGGDEWRQRFAGVEYDMHDGSGNFEVTP